MSTYLVTISSLIKTKLQGVAGLKAIYEYQPDKPTDGGYPYATITQSSFNGAFGDTQRNIRHYLFSVRVFQERTEAAFGNEKAERIMRELLDEIITAFDNDTTLNHAVKMITPISADFDYDQGEVGDLRVAEIIIDAMVVTDSM